MSEEIILTKDIHNFVRGNLNCEESLRLLDEVLEKSQQWKHDYDHK